MKERRKYRRAIIELPVGLEIIQPGKQTVVYLVTRDISFSGTFIHALTSFPKGTRFILDFTLPSDYPEELKDIKRLKNCTGKMVRSDSDGIAIQFDRECQVESLKALK